MARIVTSPDPQTPRCDGAAPGGWWHEGPAGRIVCDLCPRECSLQPGDRGFCFVRENRDGEMVLATYGRSTGFCIDPIEKKPLNHFYPGTSVLSFGTAGCNLGCKFCQNWSISKSREVRKLSDSASPAAVAHAARDLGCHSVAFTYNDPIVWAEYAIDTALACHDLGVQTVAVTAGYVSPAARAAFFAPMDAANVDLKAFTEEFYQHLTLSHLQPVLDTLRWLREETSVWFEITNLVIPRANDGTDEFRRMCDWIVRFLGCDVPVHFTAFHPDFRLRDRERTPVETLLAARRLAMEAGIRYAYVGNVQVAEEQNTFCPGCRRAIVRRSGYTIGRYEINDGCCAHCGQALAGRWLDTAGQWGSRRQPVDLSPYARRWPLAPSPRSDTPPIQETITLREPPTPSSTTSTSPKPPTIPSAGTHAMSVAQERPRISPEQEQAILQVTRQLVHSAVHGSRLEIREELFLGSAQVVVHGCFVSIKRQQQLRGCCGFLGQRVGLAQALEHSAITSATRDPRMRRIEPAELQHLQFEIWLLYGQQPVTAKGEARQEVIEIGRHGLQIQRGSSRGLLLPGVATDHGFDVPTFLRQVCLKAQLDPESWKLDDTQLFTFEGHVIKGPYVGPVEAPTAPAPASLPAPVPRVPAPAARSAPAGMSSLLNFSHAPAAAKTVRPMNASPQPTQPINSPAPQTGPPASGPPASGPPASGPPASNFPGSNSIVHGARPAAVAGTFYPADPAELQRMLDELAPATPRARRAWQAAMVPHAGLVYSGRIAADVLSRVEIPESVIILGPKHTNLGRNWAVSPHTAWSLPGREVAADPALAAELCAQVPGLELDAAAHEREHAIELELPWIARWAPQARVTGIAIGPTSRDDCRRIANALARVLLPRRERTLLLVSSDMNHFANDEQTRRLDGLALERLQAMDPDGLFQTVREHRISMCGVLPACIVLDVLRQWKSPLEAEFVSYGTSAEVTKDNSRVVGYAGMLFN